MYIPKDDTENNPFCRLKLVVVTLNTTNLSDPTNQNSLVPKVVGPTNKKTLLQNFGD